jgi:hypothetical protein
MLSILKADFVLIPAFQRVIAREHLQRVDIDGDHWLQGS